MKYLHIYKKIQNSKFIIADLPIFGLTQPHENCESFVEKPRRKPNAAAKDIDALESIALTTCSSRNITFFFRLYFLKNQTFPLLRPFPISFLSLFQSRFSYFSALSFFSSPTQQSQSRSCCFPLFFFFPF